MTDKEYQEAYQAGYQDAKDDSLDQTRKYALALIALNTIREVIDAFVKEVIPRR